MSWRSGWRGAEVARGGGGEPVNQTPVMSKKEAKETTNWSCKRDCTHDGTEICGNSEA